MHIAEKRDKELDLFLWIKKMSALELPPNLIWTLRALCQPYAKQVELYPPEVYLGDELVQDFGEEFDHFCFHNPNEVPSDLKELDSLILSKSGLDGYWEDEALKSGAFWEEIRACAKKCLLSRGLSTFAPHSSEKIYIFGP